MNADSLLSPRQSPFEYLFPISVDEIQEAVKEGVIARKLFMEEVHELHSWTAEDIFTECIPRILCRPSGEGKSTELNYVRHLFKEFKTSHLKRTIEVTFDESWMARSRGELFGHLREKLAADGALTLAEAVQANPMRPGHTLLVLDNVEKLSEDALTWLLASIHSFEESHAGLLAEQGVYIAIAGSVGVGQLSRELFSVYYTDELPSRIRDYVPDDLSRISHIVQNRFGMPIEPSALDKLYEFTSGDKRTANLLFDILLSVGRVGNVEGGRPISCGDVETALSRYLDVDFRRDSRWFKTIRAIYSTPGATRVIQTLARYGKVPWIAVSPAVQKILYNFGVVSIEGPVAQPRNEVIRLLLDRSIWRYRQARGLLVANLSVGRLLPKDIRKERAILRGSLVERAFTGSILWMCYGEVVDVNEEGDLYQIRIVDEAGNEFEAQLSARDFGMRLRPNQGFLKYAVWTPNGPREEYYFYGHQRS